MSELTQIIIAILLSYFTIKSTRHNIIILGISLWACSSFVLAGHQAIFGSGSFALSMTKKSGGLERKPFPYLNGI